jgi:hypothetical protein
LEGEKNGRMTNRTATAGWLVRWHHQEYKYIVYDFYIRPTNNE